MNAQKLIDLKEEIADKKIERGVLENKQTELLDTLKEEYNCTTIEQAEKEIKKLKRQIEIQSGKLEKGLEKLESMNNEI